MSAPLFRGILVPLLSLILSLTQLQAQDTNSHWRFSPKTGPWGKLSCVHISIEMPEAFVSLDEIKDVHARWFFKTNKREDIETLLKSAELPVTQIKILTDTLKWEASNSGFWAFPTDELVLAMSPGTRTKLYSYLAKFPENEMQYSPFIFSGDRISEMLQNSQLHDSTITQFNQLLYAKGKMKLFSDVDIMVNHLPNDQEKVRFLKTISRVSTLLVKLEIDQNSNLEQLEDYWSYGGRRKDVGALLSSMASVPGGCSIDVAHLLPNFVRQHIYTYPHPDTLNVTNQHCHWTSMNFFNDTPDNKFSDENVVKQTLGTEFTPVTDSPRLGDIFFFLGPDGSVIHSATFIADDIVFTKNGGGANRPWIYMQMADLAACYMKPEEPLQIIRVRRKHS
jgi:hypothetical protein